MRQHHCDHKPGEFVTAGNTGSTKRNLVKTRPCRHLSRYRDKTFIHFSFLRCYLQPAFSRYSPLFPSFKEGLKLNEFWIGVVMSLNGILIALWNGTCIQTGRKLPYLNSCSMLLLLWVYPSWYWTFLSQNGLLVAAFSVMVITIAEMVGMPFMNSFILTRFRKQPWPVCRIVHHVVEYCTVLGSSCGLYLQPTWAFWSLADRCSGLLYCFGRILLAAKKLTGDGQLFMYYIKLTYSLVVLVVTLPLYG